jgi:hypothetical protein
VDYLGRIGNELSFLLRIDEYASRSKSSTDHVFGKVTCNPCWCRASNKVDPRIFNAIIPEPLVFFSKAPGFPSQRDTSKVDHFFVLRIKKVSEL